MLLVFKQNYMGNFIMKKNLFFAALIVSSFSVVIANEEVAVEEVATTEAVVAKPVVKPVVVAEEVTEAVEVTEEAQAAA